MSIIGGIFERIEKVQDPWRTLGRASSCLFAVGAVLTVLGVVETIRALASQDEAGHFSHVLRSVMALVGWLVPGLIYLLCGWGIRRRQRWAIGSAELTTFVQMFFAGAMVVMSLLQIKVMWPYAIISLLWIVPLLVIPRFTAPCSRAMDMIAQLPTLGIDPSIRKKRIKNAQGS
ncbi:MAG TPA: hypothetical protein VH518_03520 [Tepidisphaeraceae bacterium]|jgi:hypothetical protein